MHPQASQSERIAVTIRLPVYLIAAMREEAKKRGMKISDLILWKLMQEESRVIF